jgi:hypothetical protein
MPPSEPVRTARGQDELDEYIRSRRERGASRAERRNPAERSRARALLQTDFAWSERAPEPVAERTQTRGPAPEELRTLREQDDEPSGRRTVVITGRGADRYVAPRRGYDSRLRPHERSGFKPDRVALWAVLLGIALVLGAATSSHAAVLHLLYVHVAALHGH